MNSLKYICQNATEIRISVTLFSSTGLTRKARLRQKGV